MTLKKISKQGQIKPPRIMIYGSHKIGKSTFAASSPKPIFIQTEDGLDNISVDAFPLAQSYQDVIDAIGTLYNEEHGYQTAVIDSMDWLEKLIWKHTSEKGGKENIEDFGYGKGYVQALDYWRNLLDGLNALRTNKNMAIVCICHAEIKRFDSPDTEPYDRYQPKLHTRATALVSEWSDAIGFANYRIITKATKKEFTKDELKHRGIGTGERLLHLEETPAYLAGNRYGLPKTIPFSWEAFSEAFNKKEIK